MKYKRLTIRSDGGYVHYNCSKKDMKDCGLYYNCGECHKSTEVLYRLAELEDKIESGLMVELPCKVGDTVYWLIASKYIIECVVSFINISVGKKTHFTVYAKQKCEGVENDFSSDDLGEEWFLTREEAEAKLLELQNK